MNQMNFELARFNMVEQQIRTWTVLDFTVLDLLKEMPREAFVPEKHKNMAYSDLAIPLPCGQEMMHPKIEAHFLQAMDIMPDDKVLEIGTGSGFLTACAAKLADHVYSVEIHPELSESAAKKLADHGISNVTLEIGDGSKGWDAHAPYNAIAITGGLTKLDDSFKNALTIGGHLVAVVGVDGPTMELIVITRTGENEWEQKSLFETELPLLVNAEAPKSFEF